MNDAPGRFSYDQLHYQGGSYLQTHPDWMAAIGRLHGMRPAPVEHCRVLEIGCGHGHNLLPMAYTSPGSTFYGIDLAAAPLETGRAHAASLGLSNLRLDACDLMDFPADAGTFDYIIAQGFYSWVPPAVRERLLALCASHLAPQGIAFVSFNAYPGYHFRDLHRRLMLYHLAGCDTTDPSAQADEALGALGFVARAQPKETPYGAGMAAAQAEYTQQVVEKGAAGLAWFHHDLLATVNAPVYFHEFAATASRHGLQFAGDATLRVPRMMEHKPETHQVLQALAGDIIRQEQYLDFVVGVPFRQVLLCHGDVPLDHSLRLAGMRGLYVAGNLSPSVAPAPAAPAAAADDASRGPDDAFAGRAGRIVVKHPAARAALARIGEAWPGAVSFEELEARQAGTGSPEELAEFLLRLGVSKLAFLTTRASVSAGELSERPEASALARLQARTSWRVTDLFHTMDTLDPFERHLLGLLDGRRDRAALLAAMRVWIKSGHAANDHRRAVADPTYPEEKKQERSPKIDGLEARLDAALRAMLDYPLLVR